MKQRFLGKHPLSLSLKVIDTGNVFEASATFLYYLVFGIEFWFSVAISQYISSTGEEIEEKEHWKKREKLQNA